MRPVSALTRLPVAAAGCLALVGLAAAPSAAAETPLTFDCQAKPPIVSAQTFDLGAGVEATAPDSVPSGSAFSVALAPAPLTVPGSVNGYTVKAIKDIKLRAVMPTNATLTDESLSGGSGTGSGTPSVAVSGGEIVMTVPGPISGGSTFTLPTLTLDLVAGAPGGTVTTRIAGTSYDNPGLTFTARVPILFFTADVPTSCFSSPSPVLSSTAVS
ncbi:MULTISPECIES: cyclase [unclassified Streptomyces]|uniref:cyclase n=1 Tax=unclassified Streptomyces TaxID=2593676 RepID=UPI001F03CFE1|nr:MULTISPECIES: cyclase [unclassified Streptomyces]MCH0564807.1 cyclodehydratase [Streptomyces sp. MUM 2J]MCH0569911.1 cyclodehydratase [Streptomyces sp. MUM 136J]